MERKILFVFFIAATFYSQKISLTAEKTNKQHCFNLSDKKLTPDEKIITNPDTLLDAATYAEKFFQQANSSTIVNSKNLGHVRFC